MYRYKVVLYSWILTKVRVDRLMNTRKVSLWDANPSLETLEKLFSPLSNPPLPQPNLPSHVEEGARD